MIAGGWAIDLFIGKETRIHSDIEIAIPRNEQLLLKKYLREYELKYVNNGVFFDWRNQFLELPIHEIHGTYKKQKIEILLNEIDNNNWIYRRINGVELTVDKLLKYSKDNIPYLCPEVVLLYKAKINKEKDKLDLKNTILKLDLASKNWLINAIQKEDKNHKWLSLIS